MDDAIDLPITDEDCWEYVAMEPSQGRVLIRRGELKLIEHFNVAVWLIEMDHLSVSFYQAFMYQCKAKACCGDLLIGNGEVLGLGERHTIEEDVMEALNMYETASNAYSWYV